MKDTKGELIIGEDSHATNLVKIVTAASRYNVGELFWLGYNPKFNKRTMLRRAFNSGVSWWQ